MTLDKHVCCDKHPCQVCGHGCKDEVDQLRFENARLKKREVFARSVAEERVGRPLKYEISALQQQIDEQTKKNENLKKELELLKEDVGEKWIKDRIDMIIRGI